MYPVNIFALTRSTEATVISRLERQMSQRRFFLNVKQWEIQGLKRLTDHLYEHMEYAHELLFYYSFQIPKLGKEFDLLRISEDTVINVELKSAAVEEEQIKKQLTQNRYYLSTLGLNIRSYTYISSEDRLIRLTGGGNIIEEKWSTLCEDLEKQGYCYRGHIEELFKEERYIISPLADPERFLRKEYFLTSQQRDIQRKILKRIEAGPHCYQGFCGLPGTGKTLLLYDIAMNLSQKQKVAVFHCGAFSKELEQLDERLKRIDFYKGSQTEDSKQPVLSQYSAILVDEAHRLNKGSLRYIVDTSERMEIPLVFCYDSEDSIEKAELGYDAVADIETLTDYTEYRLTNRIRTNSELSAFIQCIMQGTGFNHRKDYPSVNIAFATDANEACRLLEYFRDDGYMFVFDDRLKKVGCEDEDAVEVGVLGRREYNKVVMLIDESLYYETEGGLRSSAGDCDVSPVRNLFHGLNRAKNGLALVVLNNPAVFEALLTILQGHPKNSKRSRDNDSQTTIL